MALLLLVDDAPAITLIVQRYAKKAGHQVIGCLDAVQAWNRLRQGPLPELFIVDVNLPGVTGPELIRRVRATPNFAALPVALFSHWERLGDIVDGLEAGADHLLSK